MERLYIICIGVNNNSRPEAGRPTVRDGINQIADSMGLLSPLGPTDAEKFVRGQW